ncbi:hypothetical protein [Aeromicrobium sp. Root344]|uniref:hypothetical protein n=1 Tax=Aeromicrobium sp. Root344 TaxID=1736521 RepID=UPI0009EA787B|nr:hypothetical protein [Aeromicrobium sp. Root344]
MSAHLQLHHVHIVLRSLVLGVLIGGAAGGIAGLTLGLHTYVPTAWFAVLEVGIPAALVGGLLGTMVGLMLWACHKGHALWQSF